MRTSLKVVWLCATMGIIVLGATLVLLLLRTGAPWSDVVTAVALTAGALAMSVTAIQTSRRHRDRVRRRQVLISHTVGDVDVAHALARAVTRDGYWPILLSPDSGSDFVHRVESELRKSGTVLMLHPAESNETTRNWLQFEREIVREARGLRRSEAAVVPVVLSKTASLELGSDKAINLDNPAWEILLREHLARVFDDRKLRWSSSTDVSAAAG